MINKLRAAHAHSTMLSPFQHRSGSRIVPNPAGLGNPSESLSREAVENVIRAQILPVREPTQRRASSHSLDKLAQTPILRAWGIAISP
jgi:hypothetical protein